MGVVSRVDVVPESISASVVLYKVVYPLSKSFKWTLNEAAHEETATVVVESLDPCNLLGVPNHVPIFLTEDRAWWESLEFLSH